MASDPKRLRTAFSNSPAEIRARVRSLGLWGIDAEWDRLHDEPLLLELLDLEEQERGRRSLERRIRSARLGRFKSIDEFDWKWPKRIDREAVEELFRLDFVQEGINVILIGPNGVGKTTLAQNLVHCALLGGYTARFVTARATAAPPASPPRSPTRWSMHTGPASSTATSSRRTCCSTPGATSGSPTSAWPRSPPTPA